MKYLLRTALGLAKQRKGFCAPNPAVGAVVARGPEILGMGFHWGPSHPHAEIEALKDLSFLQTQQADLYVTLEPCCHHGRTPPCTDAIIKSGISRVFYGFKDPDVRVAGQGIALLEAAGIRCEHLELEEINDFYASYQNWQIHRRPRVTAKLALSLDGKIAGENGSPIKISGPEADFFTHQQRKYADALLTTAQTVIKDDPRLDVRLEAENFKKPLYILDNQLSTPITARVFQTAAQVILLHGENVASAKIAQFQEAGAICIALPCYDNGWLQWKAVFKEMGKRDVQELWIEAGSKCFESLLLGKFLDDAYLYFAPKYIGLKGVSAFSVSENLFACAEKKVWQILGEDAVCRLSFVKY